VTEPETLEILRPTIELYVLECKEGEDFGDLEIRAGYIAPTVSDLTLYDKMSGEGVDRNIAAAA